MKRILGFDVSSSSIGWSLLEIDELTKEIKYIDANYIKPIESDDIIERLAHTRNVIKNIIETNKPDYIGIENIISFMKGKSTANTIIMLTSFNRMVGLSAYDYLGHSPQLFNILSIRHGLKLTKTLPSKEEMPEIVAKHLNIKFDYEYNKKNKLKIENYDKADGICVALYYAFVLTDRTKKTKKSKKK